jgi:hypothetical protein
MDKKKLQGLRWRKKKSTDRNHIFKKSFLVALSSINEGAKSCDI